MENKGEYSIYDAKLLLGAEENGESKFSSINKDIDSLMYHLYIAHELAINDDININLDQFKEPKQVENMHWLLDDSFWREFKEQISENPPKLALAFELLTEIKKSLDFVMTPNVVNLRNDVHEVLDIETLKIQGENNAIDVSYYAKYIILVISKICAPIRDKQVAKLSKETDIVTIFQGILNILWLMKFDLLYFSLNIIKPDIMANNLAYEREKFKEFITISGGSLPLTRKWLLKHKDPKLSQKNIINNAFIDFLTWKHNEPYPETLFLEAERLKKLQLDYFRLTISCTLYCLVIGLLPSGLPNDLKDTIKSLIQINISETKNNEDVKEMTKDIAKELSTIVSNEQTHTETLQKNVTVELNIYEETLEQAALQNNAVRELVCTRVNHYLKNSLSLHSNCESNFPQTLNHFKNELKSIKLLFERIFKHNLLVCMEHYENILDSSNDS